MSADPKKLMGHDQSVQFARNLAAQEARRWAEYLETGSREALMAWRGVRRQMQNVVPA